MAQVVDPKLHVEPVLGLGPFGTQFGPSVVDEDVQPGLVFQDLSGGLANGGQRGQVQPVDDHLALVILAGCDVSGSFGRFFWAAAEEEDSGTPLGQVCCGGFAYATVGS